jgi:hypothetical protein
MGYFDALTSSAFKTTADGGRLFFPYGIIGRGYVLPSEHAYQRLQRQAKAFMIVALASIIGASVGRTYLVSGLIVVVLTAFYVIWSQLAVRGLAASDERLSLRESVTTQAVTHNATMLWAMQIVSSLFVVVGVVLVVTGSENLLVGLAAIAFFGLCAVVLAWMLVVRRRKSP